MYNRLYVLFVLFFLLIPSQFVILETDGQTSHSINQQIEYTFTFDRPTFNSIQRENKTFTRIKSGDLPLSIIPDKPEIPIKPISLLLPYQTTITSITVEPMTIKTRIENKIQNILKGSLSKQYTNKSNENTSTTFSFYDETEYYPESDWEKIGIQYQKGYPILYVNLHPVQILQAGNTLKYIPEIKITLTVTTHAQNDQPKIWAKDEIRTMVDNPEMLSTYEQSLSILNQNGAEEYEYVIITSENLSQPSESFEFSFEDLISYRESQGLSCTIKTVESIIAENEGQDTQEKIRNFIKDAYTNWNTQWVLLGGDEQIIPPRFLYSIDGQEQDEKKVASDLYYQCLDGSYNYDEDSRWGEEFDGVNGDRIDLLAEVYLGRAPVDDEQDVSAFVEKTLTYEQSDIDTDSYLSNILAAGEELWDGPGGYGKGYVERCIDYCEDFNHETYGIPSDKYDITRFYEQDQVWSDDDVIDVINNGVNIINHVGHGTMVSAMKLGTIELDELENTGKYGLFYTQACHAGQFEFSNDCFAEKWVNILKKGGFAAIMNTGYGYGSAVGYDGADNRFAREFFDALYSPNEKISRIGQANQDSKEDNIWRLSDSNMYHVYYITTLFGDPYVAIHGAKEASADFSFEPVYPTTGDIVSFYDESDGSITYRLWDFGDGQRSHEENPVHVFSSSNTFDVSLTVMDENGYMSTKTVAIEVKDYWNPIAKITPAYYNGVNLTISFSSNESWDPDGTIVDYHWDFDDGTTSSNQNPVHTFAEEGVYTVELTVKDNDNNYAKTSSNIVISQQFPPEIPTDLQGPTSAFSGSTSTFSVTSTDPEMDDIQYGWDWNGDNTVDEWSSWYTSGEQCQITHMWQIPGSYQVQVKARDENYGESSWSESIHVSVTDEAVPDVSIESPLNGLYISNNRILPFPICFVIGPVDIQVEASDASGIDKILFYIDDSNLPVAEVLSEPYSYSWSDQVFGKHEIRVIAVDNAGRQNSCELVVWKFF